MKREPLTVEHELVLCQGAFGLSRLILRRDPFQHWPPCFEPPATDKDYMFLFGADPEESYQP